ncbi:MAG: N-succinylarginine dihydrolase [Patescibacteria group bacterium]
MTEIDSQKYQEANFDGMIGPTHNYAGLSTGNVASTLNKGGPSNPRQALAQALGKARDVRDMGVPQFVLPPHERPNIPALYNLGFRGSDAEILEAAYTKDPSLVARFSSASSMWAANAATVAPSVDTVDGLLGITPASLGEKLHRTIESPITTRILTRIFADRIARVNQPLIRHPSLGDEGAANHMRFASKHGDAGVHLFVYGHDAANPSAAKPSQFPARQSLQASEAVARLNGLRPDKVLFAQQNPDAIDAGVFHNDVIAINNLNVWLLHRLAYVNTNRVIEDVRTALGADLSLVIAEADELPFEDAVKSYVFNSQIVSKPDGSMVIIVPEETIKNENARRFLERTVNDQCNPISGYQVADVKQSMQNGGGPACLRLRVVLSQNEISSINDGARVYLDDALYGELTEWGNRNYRDRLMPGDLRDPNLLVESRTALDELSQILKLGSVYDFQR